MLSLTRNRVGLTAGAILASLAVFVGACGSDDDAPSDRPQASETTSDPGASVPSSGSVAPNTFLTYDGQRYRLVELMQADLIDDGGFQEVGEATDADIDQEDLTVYRKGDDPDAVYTYAEGTESEAVGEGIPALWYRWELEP